MKRKLFVLMLSFVFVLASCGNVDTKSAHENTQFVQTESDAAQIEEAQLLTLCEEVDTRYYEALYSMKECDFSDYIAEDALNEYKTKALQKEICQRQEANLNNMTFETKYELSEKKVMGEDVYYLKLNTTRRFSDGSESGSNVWFLVKNENGKMLIIDWNDNRIDSIDVVLGENREPHLPVVWEDEAWTQNILQEISK